MINNETIDGVSRELLEWSRGVAIAVGAEKRLEQLVALLDKPVVSINKQLLVALQGMVEYFPEGHSDGECFSVDRAKEVLALATSELQEESKIKDLCIAVVTQGRFKGHQIHLLHSENIKPSFFYRSVEKP